MTWRGLEQNRVSFKYLEMDFVPSCRNPGGSSDDLEGVGTKSGLI